MDVSRIRMKITLALVVVCLALVSQLEARPDTKYTDRYDNINLDQIIGNRRLLIPYLNCVLDKGKCTAEGKELKSHISDALMNGCNKCTPKQRDGSTKVINHLIGKENDYWQQLVAKYDPQHVYTKKYEEDLKKITAA